jgi:hypothetical protein
MLAAAALWTPSEVDERVALSIARLNRREVEWDAPLICDVKHNFAAAARLCFTFGPARLCFHTLWRDRERDWYAEI